MSASADPRSARDLIEAVRRDVPERAAALEVLRERAAASGGNPQRYAELAEACGIAEAYDEAIPILRQLVELDPGQDGYRFNLAMAYWQTEQVELCRQQLSHLAAHAASEELRGHARAQLEQYESALGLGELDQQLVRLQEASLREQIAAPEAPAPAYVRLARLLLRQGRLFGREDVYAGAAAMLEEGRRRFPQNTAILELLIASYLHHDAGERLDDAVRALEQIDPDSPALAALGGDVDDQAADSFRSAMSTRINVLFQQATDGDESTRASALDGMRRLVAQAPRNPDYRVSYAFALAANGARQEALEQAAVLSQRPVESHGLHFNLGQVYWLCGDAANGRRHLDLALRYAHTDEERQDVRERVAYLESSS